MLRMTEQFSSAWEVYKIHRLEARERKKVLHKKGICCDVTNKTSGNLVLYYLSLDNYVGRRGQTMLVSARAALTLLMT